MAHDKRFSGDMDRLRNADRVKRLEVERVVDLCLEKGGIARVLDVGTGTGLFAEAFSRRGLQAAGLDVNPELLRAARGLVPNVKFREGTAENIPYPAGSVDLAFLGLVLHETDDLLLALREANRVTRKSVGILEWPYRDQDFGPPLADRLNPQDLEGSFRSAGFGAWRTVELANTVLYLLEK